MGQVYYRNVSAPALWKIVLKQPDFSNLFKTTTVIPCTVGFGKPAKYKAGAVQSGGSVLIISQCFSARKRAA